ncbi:YggS family pyridoxal phosphate-dependent enzyme [bacterium]|nr:YggS family pyridoxal phosphate-dependent enzyme [bacterium]
MGAEGLKRILDRVHAACLASGRDPTGVTLVAVSKTATDDQVLAAYAAGHRDFGENRAPDIERRSQDLPGDIRWHFIGRLQGNKVNRVRPVSRLLHSLDRHDLARYWARGEGPHPPVLVQVNIAEEPQKAGVMPDDAAGLVAHCLELGLEVAGLMTMPPLTADPEGSRPHFSGLSQLRDTLSARFGGLGHLSMGMTDDFEVAIAEGATLLRIGRAIFDGVPQAETGD